MTFHEEIYQKMLEYRKRNPAFNFIPRQRNTKNRFNLGFWFQGDENYAFVGLVNASGGANMTRSVGLVFFPKDGYYDFRLEVVYKGIKAEKALELYADLIETFQLEKDGKEKYIKPLGNTADGFEVVYKFLDENYAKIGERVLERKLFNFWPTEEVFEGFINKVNSHRDRLLNKPSYWLFQANPKIYNIKNALAGAHLKSWKVSAHKDKIKSGDKVIIWQSGEHAGCYALAEVTSEVWKIPEEDYELRYYLSEEDKSAALKQERVKLRITKYLGDNPVLWSNIKDLPEFANFNVGTQGTNFQATEEEYNKILKLSEEKLFTWIETYKGIVAFLKGKENQQIELIELLKELDITLNKDEKAPGIETALEVIDPFTFFCYLNKFGSERRIEIFQDLAKRLGLVAPIDDSGLPTASAHRTSLFPFQHKRTNEIERLWNFFYKILDGVINDELFADVLSIHNIGKAKLTEVLFYVDPHNNFPINKPGKTYLRDILKISPKFKTYTEYKAILTKIKEKSGKSFYELSHEAWLWTNSKDEFLKVIAKHKDNEVNDYFLFLDSIVEHFDLGQGDERLALTTSNDDLNLTIGQRYCWNLFLSNSSKGKLGVISTNEINENSELFGEKNRPKAFYTYFNDIKVVTNERNTIVDAIAKELNRTQISRISQYDNKIFRKAVFDKNFRKELLNLKDTAMKDELTQNNKELNSPLNQILYGPPGTGKTYKTVEAALKIVDPEFYEKNKKNRKELNQRYNELLITDFSETKGQIAFCTFHQSFTYEDFVEGIKPKTNDNKEVEYEIEAGIFKNICELAEGSKSAQKIEDSEDVKFTSEDFEKAHFYKLSLGDSTKVVDKEIYDYCIKENCISIGFGGPHDYSGMTETEIKEKCKDLPNAKVDDGSQLSMFIHSLKTEDYILISNGNHFVRALGKVVGDYEYHDNRPIQFNHFRKVEWIFKDENIPINDIYELNLMQRTIYKMDHNKLKEEFFVKDYRESKIDHTKKKQVKPYVLIIDEINRGNVTSIFGELITLIEDDKRAGNSEELKLILPYSKMEFSVPNNVHIIGTMNTADRSIEALDSAFRRRFSFTEMQAKPHIIKEILGDNAVWKEISLVEVLETINKRISVLIDRDHSIGHSYFLKLKGLEGDDFSNGLKKVFSDNIIPLLQEYFFNDFVKMTMVLGAGFIESKPIEDQIFAEVDDSLEDDYTDGKIYSFRSFENLSDAEFENALSILLNK